MYLQVQLFDCCLKCIHRCNVSEIKHVKFTSMNALDVWMNISCMESIMFQDVVVINHQQVNIIVMNK